jgi:hypothetical protein
LQENLELLFKEQQQEMRMRLGLHRCFRVFQAWSVGSSRVEAMDVERFEDRRRMGTSGEMKNED